MKLDKTDTWICPRCGLINSNKEHICTHCFYTKGDNAINRLERIKAPHPWICSVCGTKNTGNVCSRCGGLEVKNNTIL